MRRSSNSNSPVTLDHERATRQRGFIRFFGILGSSVMLMLSSCSSPPSIPPWFEAFERFPIKTVLVQNQHIAYLDVGEGPVVILIHGFGGSMWQWEHQQTALSKHFRVITPDLLGSGFSDKPEIEYSPDEMMAFFIGFMDQLQLHQANLVGNSMGAGLAMGIALEYPKRVANLVLIDGLPPHVMEHLASPTLRRAMESHAPSWLVSFGNWLFGGTMTESVLREFIHEPSLITPAVVERSNRNRMRPGQFRPLLRVKDHLPSWEERFAPRIGQVIQRTLIIWGEEDRVFPIRVGEILNKTISGSTLIRIPQTGHIPQWERPDLVNPELIRFLQP